MAKPDMSDKPTNMREVSFWKPIGSPKTKYHRCIDCGQLMVLCKECEAHHHDSNWIQDHVAFQKGLIEGRERMRRQREREFN